MRTSMKRRTLALGLGLAALAACATPRDDASEQADAAVSQESQAIVESPDVSLSVLRVAATHALINVTVAPGTAPGECGYCWGPERNVEFVDQRPLGPAGQRCVRQPSCVNGSYYTDDGFMVGAEYASGERYYVRGYRRDASGAVVYTPLTSFVPPGPRTMLSSMYIHEASSWDRLVYSRYAGLAGSYENAPREDGVSECGVCWGLAAAPTLVAQSNDTMESVRCVRIPGCQDLRGSEFYRRTDDNPGDQAQITYLPGIDYRYRAYDVLNGEVRYGKVRQFTVPPYVFTNPEPGPQTRAHTFLRGTIVTYAYPPALLECGICWGDYNHVEFVDTPDNGRSGAFCMRQLGCGSLDFGYWTDDGFMVDRRYDPYASYAYKAYARDLTGYVFYGDLAIFTVY